MSKMILARILALVVGYFFGTFQTGYFYGKAHGIDVREHGSGNSGTTNTLRTLGWKAGAVTFFGDLFKAITAVLIFYFIYRNTYPQAVKCIELYAGFGAVLGHNFPFFLSFMRKGNSMYIRCNTCCMSDSGSDMSGIVYSCSSHNKICLTWFYTGCYIISDSGNCV